MKIADDWRWAPSFRERADTEVVVCLKHIAAGDSLSYALVNDIEGNSGRVIIYYHDGYNYFGGMLK